MRRGRIARTKPAGLIVGQLKRISIIKYITTYILAFMNKKKMKKGMQCINFPTQAALNMGMRHEVSSPKLIFRMKFECIL